MSLGYPSRGARVAAFGLASLAFLLGLAAPVGAATVNYIEGAWATSAGTNPAYVATGSDANIGIGLTPKGTGGVGISTTSPQSLLHVYNGEVQVGSSGASCAAANNGAVRFSGTTLYYCTGTTWTAAGGSTTLNGITAATANQAGIANGAYTIQWNWDTLTTGTALTLASASMTSGSLLGISNTHTTGTGIALSAATATTGGGKAIQAYASGSTGANIAVFAQSDSTDGGAIGVWGYLPAAAGTGTGVFGRSDSTAGGIGVWGWVPGATGGNKGVYGRTDSTTANATGVFGDATATTGATDGVWGQTGSTTGSATGVFGFAWNTTGVTYGVVGQTSSTTNGATGVFGNAAATSGQLAGVYGTTASTTAGANGVQGYASGATGATYGVYGADASATGYGGYFTDTSGGGIALQATLPTLGAVNTNMDVAYFSANAAAGGAAQVVIDNIGSATKENDLVFASNGTALWAWLSDVNDSNTATFGLADRTSHKIVLLVDTSDNVGIGTTTPAQVLNVRSPGTGDYGVLIDTPAGTASGPMLELKHNGTGGRDYKIFSDGSSNGPGAGFLEFYDATAGATRMVIGSTGTVGIGSASPAALLDVAGNVKLGAAGTAMTAMGVCTVASYTPSTATANKTCTGVPASTSVAVHCSASGAFSTTAANGVYARATGTVNQIAANTNAANTTAVTLTCMWVQP